MPLFADLLASTPSSASMLIVPMFSFNEACLYNAFYADDGGGADIWFEV